MNYHELINIYIYIIIIIIITGFKGTEGGAVKGMKRSEPVQFEQTGDRRRHDDNDDDSQTARKQKKSKYDD